MKKIFLLLVMLLSFPIFVKAEESVVITKVELENKTDSTIVIEEPTFNIRKINFNLKFSEVGDYAEYKVTLKNNSDKDYEIKNENNYLDSEYIKYEFSYGDSNILKAKEEKSIYIKLLYNKKVSEEHFVDGKYILNDSVKLDLVNDSIVVKVPPTHKGYSMFMVILGIFSLTISFILLILIKDEKVKTLLLICLLIIPFTVLALESLILEIDAKIEINSKFTGSIYRWSVKGWANKDSSAASSRPYTIANLTEGTDYVKNATLLNKTYYLKHDVVEDEITASYVCFVYNNVEHCMIGADGGAFATNTVIIQDYQTFYNLNNVSTPTLDNPGCSFGSSSSNCIGGGFDYVSAGSSGNLHVGGGAVNYCRVSSNGGSDCYGW